MLSEKGTSTNLDYLKSQEGGGAESDGCDHGVCAPQRETPCTRKSAGYNRSDFDGSGPLNPWTDGCF